MAFLNLTADQATAVKEQISKVVYDHVRQIEKETDDILTGTVDNETLSRMDDVTVCFFENLHLEVTDMVCDFLENMYQDVTEEDNSLRDQVITILKRLNHWDKEETENFKERWANPGEEDLIARLKHLCEVADEEEDLTESQKKGYKQLYDLLDSVQ